MPDPDVLKTDEAKAREALTEAITLIFSALRRIKLDTVAAPYPAALLAWQRAAQDLHAAEHGRPACVAPTLALTLKAPCTPETLGVLTSVLGAHSEVR